jgi:hypothetical protein
MEGSETEVDGKGEDGEGGEGTQRLDGSRRSRERRRGEAVTKEPREIQDEDDESDSENGGGSDSEDQDEGELIFLEGNEAAYVKHIYNRESVLLSRKEDLILLDRLRLAGRKSESEVGAKNENDEDKKRHSEDEGLARRHPHRVKATGWAPSSPPTPPRWVRGERGHQRRDSSDTPAGQQAQLNRTISFVRRAQQPSALRQADD